MHAPWAFPSGWGDSYLTKHTFWHHGHHRGRVIVAERATNHGILVDTHTDKSVRCGVHGLCSDIGFYYIENWDNVVVNVENP